MENHSNSQSASNGHLTSLGRSLVLYGLVVPSRFKSYEPTTCEVPVCEVFHLVSVASCKFSNLAFFLFIFLAFFLVIWVSLTISGISFSLLFLSSLTVVASHCWGALKGSEVNNYFLNISSVCILLSWIDRFFKPSFILSTLISNSLTLCPSCVVTLFSCFELSSHSSFS